MKKTLLTIGLFTSLLASAQTTVTFDDLTLAPNSHYDGSDLNGGFTSGGTFFPNSYDTTYDYWANGFIYSNTTDVTTAGYTNDFSAFTGIGANNSANYGICYNGFIEFTSPRIVNSMYVTNTTFAALSMRNGDLFGKIFGTPYNASGNTDGTNGEDFFRLVVKGIDQAGVVMADSVVFYLADFRFSADSLDYILDSWGLVNLTSLGNVYGLNFELQSSDVGQFGMNTPGYFAFDDLNYSSLSLTEKSTSNLSIYPNPSNATISLKGMAGEVTILSTDGKVVFSGNTTNAQTISVESLENGLYHVICTNKGLVSRATFVKN